MSSVAMYLTHSGLSNSDPLGKKRKEKKKTEVQGRVEDSSEIKIVIGNL